MWAAVCHLRVDRGTSTSHSESHLPLFSAASNYFASFGHSYIAFLAFVALTFVAVVRFAREKPSEAAVPSAPLRVQSRVTAQSIGRAHRTTILKRQTPSVNISPPWLDFSRAPQNLSRRAWNSCYNIAVSPSLRLPFIGAPRPRRGETARCSPACLQRIRTVLQTDEYTPSHTARRQL